jgi:hypothetical protein
MQATGRGEGGRERAAPAASQPGMCPRAAAHLCLRKAVAEAAGCQDLDAAAGGGSHQLRLAVAVQVSLGGGGVEDVRVCVGWGGGVTIHVWVYEWGAGRGGREERGCLRSQHSATAASGAVWRS